VVGLQTQEIKSSFIPGMVSVVILTRNLLNITIQCVSSIERNTKEKIELVFVDNGSTDGTVEFLRSIPGAKVIANSENRGFSAGCNQGMLAAKGEYIVLLNNDTVVTDGWLTRLLRWLNWDSSIGIVGPRSNAVHTKEQVVRNISYQTIIELESFVQDWKEKYDQQGCPTNQLSGVCMAFHRNLIEQIGGLDERFFPGCFEDDDFCIRTQISGKKLWIANDVFIHHYGSPSFIVNQEYSAYEMNRVKFFEKWGVGSSGDSEELIEREKPFCKERHYIPLHQ
jgi:GT2 family glycosyltransferase